MQCRGCQSKLDQPFLNLGLHPLSNAFVKKEQAQQGEMFYPLEVFACKNCWLVQLSEPASREEIFTEDYVYFSSFSNSWLKHAEAYAQNSILKFNLNHSAHVVEIASNDGYLLQYFKNAGINVLGIEPCASVAEAAIKKGIPSLIEFFGEKSALKISQEKGHADLICANNVLAHVPNLVDFLKGFKILLNKEGVISFEFPHLLNTIKGLQFDTIYHEHFSYLSLIALDPLFKKVGLRVFEVEKLATHGGSLRLWLTHIENKNFPESQSVSNLIKEEIQAGLNCFDTYNSYQKKVLEIKENLIKFLIHCHRDEKKVVAYGAAAKGNTLLNYCGVGSNLIHMVADKNPAKQNRLLPGSRIPVVSPKDLLDSKADYILILPWNLKNEIASELQEVRKWDAKFVVAIPKLELF